MRFLLLMASVLAAALLLGGCSAYDSDELSAFVGTWEGNYLTTGPGRLDVRHRYEIRAIDQSGRIEATAHLFIDGDAVDAGREVDGSVEGRRLRLVIPPADPGTPFSIRFEGEMVGAVIDGEVTTAIATHPMTLRRR